MDDPSSIAAAAAGGRVCSISLRKTSVVVGTVQWWSQLRASDPELDVTAFADRRQASAFANVWNEAHAEFKRRVAARQPIELDVGDDQVSSDDE